MFEASHQIVGSEPIVEPKSSDKAGTVADLAKDGEVRATVLEAVRAIFGSGGGGLGREPLAVLLLVAMVAMVWIHETRAAAWRDAMLADRKSRQRLIHELAQIHPERAVALYETGRDDTMTSLP